MIAADGRKIPPCRFEKELPGVCQEKTEAKPLSPVAGIALLYLLPDKAACSKQFPASICHLHHQLMCLQAGADRDGDFWVGILQEELEPQGGVLCPGCCFRCGKRVLILCLRKT